MSTIPSAFTGVKGRPLVRLSVVALGWRFAVGVAILRDMGFPALLRIDTATRPSGPGQGVESQAARHYFGFKTRRYSITSLGLLPTWA